jgi:hypothetical protein
MFVGCGDIVNPSGIADCYRAAGHRDGIIIGNYFLRNAFGIDELRIVNGLDWTRRNLLAGTFPFEWFKGLPIAQAALWRTDLLRENLSGMEETVRPDTGTLFACCNLGTSIHHCNQILLTRDGSTWSTMHSDDDLRAIRHLIRREHPSFDPDCLFAGVNQEFHDLKSKALRAALAEIRHQSDTVGWLRCELEKTDRLYRSVNHELIELQREHDALSLHSAGVESRLSLLENSTAWRMTAPLRFVLGRLRSRTR